METRVASTLSSLRFPSYTFRHCQFQPRRRKNRRISSTPNMKEDHVNERGFMKTLKRLGGQQTTHQIFLKLFKMTCTAVNYYLIKKVGMYYCIIAWKSECFPIYLYRAFLIICADLEDGNCGWIYVYLLSGKSNLLLWRTYKKAFDLPDKVIPHRKFYLNSLWGVT